MRTSTKILIVFAIIFTVASIFLTKFWVSAIIPTGTGFTFSFTPLGWLGLAINLIAMVFQTILFVRFLKTQRLTNVIFFSMLPLTVVYGVVMVGLISVKELPGTVAESVRATLNIETAQNSYNNYLWAGLATIVYLVLMFVTILISCRPLSKVEKITEKLGDGRMKIDDFRVGGGKQFQEIENSLNKINFQYKEKENRIRYVNLEEQKSVSKQFLKFMGKSAISQLEVGQHVTKSATILFCDLISTSKAERSLSLEENFNYINSYLKTVVPLVKKFDGFIDRCVGEGVLSVFAKPQNAIECAHAILRAVAVKNKSQKDLPDIDARIVIYTDSLVFGIIGEQQKMPSIISDVTILAGKMQEINQYINTKLLIAKPSLNDLPQNFEFNYRYIGELTLDDKTQLPLYESLNYHTKSHREKLKKTKNKFEAGVRAYDEKDYQLAKELFEFVLKTVPEDKAAYVYFNKASEKAEKAA